MSIHFCHKCGDEISSGSGSDLCPACSGPAVEALYTTRSPTGKIHAPLPHHRIVEQLEKGFLTDDEEIKAEGERFIPISVHPAFAGYFIEGDSRAMQLDETQKLRRRTSRRYRNREMVSRLAAVGKLALVAGIFGGAWMLRDLWLPHEIIETVENAADGHEEEEVVQQGASRKVVLLEELAERLGDVSGLAETHLEEGWGELLSGNADGPMRAQYAMQRAVLLSDAAPFALSGLVVAKSSMYTGEVSELNEIRDLIVTLTEVVRGEGSYDRPDSWELELGHAGLALYSDLLPEAITRAEACLRLKEVEPSCAWILASARIQTDAHADGLAALEISERSWGEAPEVLAARARAQLGRGDLNLAREAIVRAVAASPENASFEATAGWIEYGAGNLEEAAARFERALDLGESDAELLLTLGKLRLQVLGDAEASYQLLQQLVEQREDPSWHEIALHASHAARASGDLEVALAWANEIVEERNEWAPAVLALAQALTELERYEEAAAAFARVPTGSISGREAGRFYTWVANFHISRDQGRLANIAIDEADNHDPDWDELLLTRLRLALAVEGKLSVVALTEGMHLLDLEWDQSRTPIVDCWYPIGESRGIAESVAQLFDKDPAAAAHIDRTVGLAGLVGCLRGHDCSSVATRLDRALQRDRTDVAALAGMGRVMLYREEWQRSGRYIGAALGEAGDSPVLQSMYGEVLMRQGRIAEAEDAFRQSSRMGSNSPATLRRYTAALIEWGRLREARDVAERGLAIAPDDIVTRRTLLAAEVAAEDAAQ